MIGRTRLAYGLSHIAYRSSAYLQLRFAIGDLPFANITVAGQRLEFLP